MNRMTTVMRWTIVTALVVPGCSRQNPDFSGTESASAGNTMASMSGPTGPTSAASTMSSAPSSTGSELDGGSNTSGDDNSGSVSQGETDVPDEPSPCCEPGGECSRDTRIFKCACDFTKGCCNDPWSPECILVAINECDLSCPFDCCIPHATGGCFLEDVEDAVCNDPVAGDPSCCDTEWNEDCVRDAILDHGVCVSDGPCCERGPGPGCFSDSVVACVCAFDPLCCIAGWNERCVDAAMKCGEC
ncbi:MAG: hypothetical protein AAGF11_04335 [Myxococcota bacterium]